MAPRISVQHIGSLTLAAVRRQVFIPDIPRACQPALDAVQAFLRGRPGLGDKGRNVFLYRHPERMALPMTVDFGVEVTRPFDDTGEVQAVNTPQGEAAVALHVGAYDGLPQTHAAIHAWAAQEGRAFAGWSMEIYGDWTADSSKLETRVVYFLA